VVSSSCGEARWLPRSLRAGEAYGTQTARFMAGAPNYGAEEKTGHSGRDDGEKIGEEEAPASEGARYKGPFFN
jgi:hypothetical protein